MTNKEAIKILNNLSSVSLNWYDTSPTKKQKEIIEKDIEALAIAVKYLEKEIKNEE